MDGRPYTQSLGRYADWEDFDALVHSVFTDRFWAEKNQDDFINVDGTVYFIYASRGGGCYNERFTDTFTLISQTEDEIAFTLTGHYSYRWPMEGESYEDRDRRLESGWDWTGDFTLRMVRTGDGWRFDRFYSALSDEEQAEKVDGEVFITPLGEGADGLHTEFSLAWLGHARTFSGHGLAGRDIAVYTEDYTGDGIPDVAIRLVAGRGTGLYQEELHLFDGTDLTEIPCDDLVAQLTALVTSTLEDGVLTITMGDRTVSVPLSEAAETFAHAAHLGNFYWFSAENGTLYCEMLCGTGPAQFYGSIVFELALSEGRVTCTGADFRSAPEIPPLL